MENKHSHLENDKDHLREHDMIQALKEAAKFPGNPQVIYDRIAPRHIKAAESISLQRASNIINQVRNAAWNIPKCASLEEISKMLKDHEPLKDYYQTYVEAEDRDDGTIMIFADNKTLERLNNAKNLYFDGNFKVVPKEPETMQLWNILMKEHGSNEVTLVGFAWCTNSNHGTYCAVLKYLKEKAPLLAKNLETIFTDFEQAAILAFNYMFPGVIIHGCWFHYSQAIGNKWDELSLVEKGKAIQNEDGKEIKKRRAPREILYVCRNLPLLPANRMNDGITYVHKLISEHIKEWPDLQIFFDYLVKQWGGKADILSCFGHRDRSNNHSENFNKTLLDRIGGKHPTLRDFLYNMHNIISVESTDINKRVKAHRDTNQVEKYKKNSRISEALHKLIADELTVEYFLYECMSEETQNYIDKEREIYDWKNAIARPKMIQPLKIIVPPEVEEPNYGAIKRKEKNKGVKCEGINIIDSTLKKSSSTGKISHNKLHSMRKQPYSTTKASTIKNNNTEIKLNSAPKAIQQNKYLSSQSLSSSDIMTNKENIIYLIKSPVQQEPKPVSSSYTRQIHMTKPSTASNSSIIQNNNADLKVNTTPKVIQQNKYLSSASLSSSNIMISKKNIVYIMKSPIQQASKPASASYIGQIQTTKPTTATSSSIIKKNYTEIKLNNTPKAIQQNKYLSPQSSSSSSSKIMTNKKNIVYIMKSPIQRAPELVSASYTRQMQMTKPSTASSSSI
ncbi:hypothetical protein HCN44_011044 [Aphidius gifuensis]|uniref:MULE transposase domain-containing protein n=1 Tax=Aphidius gifuensis TaxID=684658 RepID=A0A835CUX2_APHGI|nr:hypothetical protein HCN44_011044 [Aphidius gifuensis]